MNTGSEILSRPFEDILHKARELRDQKCLTEAGKLFGHLLSLDPHHFQSLLAMGVICQLAGNTAEAHRYLETAVAIDPKSVSALVNHGVVLHMLERYEEALNRFDQALALKPDHVEAIANRGTTLRHMHRYDESLEHYNRALAMKPDYAKAIANRGLTLHLMGRYAESTEDYRRSLLLDPTYHHARWNLGINQLITGNWKDGWVCYEWRWENDQVRAGRLHGKPLWTGKEDLTGKTILLWAEQGFGDSIQFCRYVELVAARGGHVLLQTDMPALGRLFSTLKGAGAFIDRQGNPPDIFDYHRSLMSLPLVFHTTPETVPSNIPYLFRDPALVRKWRQRLGASTRRRIGIAWSGNPKYKNDKVRSVPLHHFLRLKESGSELFVVQKNIRPEAEALLAQHPDIHVFGPEDLTDFAETAALMECMDLIISSDTSTAHLAGALGLPVWITLSFVPEWRWMAEGTKTPWYPTATLFRQTKHGDWDGVMDRMLDRLKTETVRSEFIINTTPQSTQNILAASSSNTSGYPTVSLDNSHDKLTMRVHQDDPKVSIPNSDWAYADCTSAPFPGVPNPQKVCLKNGFDTNHIYELIYTAKDPIVMGLGLAAIRDVAAFFRDGSKDDQGNRNPLAGDLKYALMNGISQSGRLLRTYLALGFNEGENHEQVFDGMHPHIGSVRNYINVRFSQPGRLAGTQHTEKQYPGPESPLTYGVTHDPLAGETEGLFDRCRRTHTCPNIVHTMSDIEYWEASGAGDTTDPAGRRDVHIPDNVRIFEFSSTQHGGFSPVAALPTSTGICQQLPNANSYTYNIRALLVALQQWVAAGREPPASLYSRIEHHSLVPLDRFEFPDIPNVTGPEGVFNTRFLYNRGPSYDTDDVSGIISVEPPEAVAEYPALVPEVDNDGNDIDGLRSITLQVPLGTYTGWNVRRAGFSEGDACDLTGSYIPFAVTKAQRTQSGDSRPSLEERYGTLANYTALAQVAADKLIAQRLLLAADEAAAIQSATNQAQQAGLK